MAEGGYFAHESRRRIRVLEASEDLLRRLTVARLGGRGESAVGDASIDSRGALELWLDSRSTARTCSTRAGGEIGVSAWHAVAAPGVFEGRDVTILTTDFGARS